MKILITGSDGTIGTELCPYLESKGHTVWGLDKKGPTSRTSPKFFVRRDLTEPLILYEKFDLIIHLAANARVHDLVIEPKMSLDNVIMTFNILEYARKTGVPKVIFASSREVYGNGNEMPVSESVGSQRTSESPYASSKLAGESYCHSYAKCYGIDTKVVRFSNVYGMHDFSNRFIPKTIRLLKENKPIEIWGEDKILDFTYITDAVFGVTYVAEVWPSDNEFNIAYGKGETLLSVAEKLKSKLDSKSEIVIGESKVGEVTEYTADVSRMADLGWRAFIDIDSGLDKAVSYYAHN